ncbi:MAG: hypothetical protein QXO37_07910 [Candidatus Nitrosocaldaceae archaeon]
MLLFKREFIESILNGREVETRRIYNVCRIVYIRQRVHLLQNNICKQRLGYMSKEEALREGFNSLEEFRNAWIRAMVDSIQNR